MPLVALVIASPAGGSHGSAWHTEERAHVTDSGAAPDRGSGGPEISADGRLVAFTSFASNTVTGDDNNECGVTPNPPRTDNCADLFVYDRESGDVELVSLSPTGAQFDAPSIAPSLSADGRYIAFEVADLPLLQYGGNNNKGVYLRDRETDTTVRIASGRAASISADGRYVAYTASLASPSSIGSFNQVYLWDRETAQSVLVSKSSEGETGNDHSSDPELSGDGSTVAFGSLARNLVDEVTERCDNGIEFVACPDIYVHEIASGETTRVSIATDGGESDGGSLSASISHDGRFVAFASRASNLAPDDETCLQPPPVGPSCLDIFIHDRGTGETSLVSQSSDGVPGNSESEKPDLSADGSTVAFLSTANNLVEGYEEVCDGGDDPCQDLYIRDLVAGETHLASISAEGEQAEDDSGSVGFAGAEDLGINGDGTVVAYTTTADNLVPGATGPGNDVLIAVRAASATPTASPTTTGGPTSLWGDSDCNGAIGSRDGQALLRNVLSQNALSQTEPCPDVGATHEGRTWGDWDCSGSIGARDNQALLRHILSQNPLSQTEPCPDIGTATS
jgi:Tol biopolymer transport system component